MTSSMADPDYCPFLQLHPNIELAILEQLEFRDFINLALSCRKWYQTASSAPNHVKPIGMFDRIHVSNGGFMLYFKYPEISKLVSTSHLKFTLVNKIKCKEVRIERKESDKLDGSSVLELVRFLWSNKQYFDIDLIHIDWPQIDDEEYVFLEPVFDITPSISFAKKMDNFPFKVFFEEHLAHEFIKSSTSFDCDPFMVVLKQCMKGERPNLKSFTATFNNYMNTMRLRFLLERYGTLEHDEMKEGIGELMDYTVKIPVSGSSDIILEMMWPFFELKKSADFHLMTFSILKKDESKNDFFYYLI